MQKEGDRLDSQKTLLAINDIYPNLYEKEKKVAKFVINHPQEVSEMNIMELAAKSGVSDATVIRFSKKVGFQGFYHLKIALATECTDLRDGYILTLKSENVKANITSIFEHKINELRETMNTLDEKEVEESISLIHRCDTLYLFAAGNTNPVAEYASFQFNLAGVKTVVNKTPEAQINSAYLMKPSDVALAITYSGNTNMLLDVFTIAKQRRIPSICITGVANSPVAKLCNRTLRFVSMEKAFFEAFSSTKMNAMAVVDMLVMLVAQDKENNSLPYNSEREKVLAKYKV